MRSDCFRPVYHFTTPKGNGNPGDPNGCFYAQRLHHLMFLYAGGSRGFCWGHAVSADLLHWQLLPDALEKAEHDDGCFSGGAFVDDDGTAYLSFWIYNREDVPVDDDSWQGIQLAFSRPPYHIWTRMTPVAIPSYAWGMAGCEDAPIACADPSNIWKAKGRYYLQTGNLMVLNRYGREAASPACFKGGWTELFSSVDLKKWAWEGRFYGPVTGPDAPDDTEDAMCPSLLPLPESKEGGQASGEFLQLFISHNRGCQYFIGSLDETQHFHPRLHGRMTWVDDAFFAPEAYMDGQGRQLMVAWLRDNRPDEYQRFGWSGVMSLPRVLWRQENGTLGIAPAPEIDQLAREEHSYDADALTTIAAIPLPSDSCRIRYQALNALDVTGLRFQMDTGCVEIRCDPRNGWLVLDATKSGSEVRAVREQAPLVLPREQAPFVTVYLDRGVIEVFACDTQAITRRVYAKMEGAVLQPLGASSMAWLQCARMEPIKVSAEA